MPFNSTDGKPVDFSHLIAFADRWIPQLKWKPVPNPPPLLSGRAFEAENDEPFIRATVCSYVGGAFTGDGINYDGALSFVGDDKHLTVLRMTPEQSKKAYALALAANTKGTP